MSRGAVEARDDHTLARLGDEAGDEQRRSLELHERGRALGVEPAPATAVRMCAASFVAASGLSAHAHHKRTAPRASATVEASGFIGMGAASDGSRRVY